MNKWWTVHLISDRGDGESGPMPESWDHPFNYDTAEEAMEAARDYYSVLEEVHVVSARPATEQEVIEFLDECYGHHDDLPF